MAQLGVAAGDLALLAGCPPCQGFSTLRTLNGRKNVVEPMNDLVFEFLRFIKAMRPQAIMLENVPGLARDQRLVRFRRAISAMGYKSCFDVFDAADFEVPQRRRRMILLAARSAKPVFAEPIEERRTVRSVLSDLPRPMASRALSIRWVELDDDTFFEIDREENLIRLNRRYRSAIIGGRTGSVNDAPLVKALIYLLAEGSFRGSFLGARSRDNLAIWQSILTAAARAETK